MTDMEALKALFDKWEVSYDGEEDNEIILEANSGPKVDGYGYFYTAFEFAEDGSFVKVGIWE